MDYSKFGVEDFLCDISFLEYCIGTNEEAVVFWTEWLVKHPEKLKAANSAHSLYYALNGNISAESFHEDFEAFKNAFSGTLPLPVEPVKVIRIRKNNRCGCLYACSIWVVSFQKKQNQSGCFGYRFILQYTLR
jgi:hypothetical protein